MPGPVFRSNDRIALRPVELEDAEFVARGRNDPQVRRWLPRAHPMSVEQVEAQFESDDDWDGVSFVVTPADDDRRLGLFSLFDVTPESGRGRLAAWLAPEGQERGYGTAAGRELLAYAFAERRLHKLVAGALATNDRSRALMESVGFEQEGHQAEHYYVDGEWTDRVVYGLLRADWEASR